jgi:hypothetical protein
MARDLIKVFCKGEGKRFAGIVCRYFDLETHECRLLREFDLKEIFENGRCAPLEMVKRALSKHLDKYRDVIQPSEHLKAMAFEIATRLASKRLNQGFQIYVLQGYINRTVYCSVIEMLRREDPLMKRQCGNCKNLSLSRPHTCQCETIITPTEGEQPNPIYNMPRNFTDRACQYGFDPIETTSIDASPMIRSSLQTTHLNTTGILVADMMNMLAHRAEEAVDRRTKKRHNRQHLVFCQLITMMEQGATQNEAVSNIAEALEVSEKTIHREISELKAFFQEKDVL